MWRYHHQSQSPTLRLTAPPAPRIPLASISTEVRWMSLVPSTYRCCQPRADLGVSGKAVTPRPVRLQEARRPATGQPARNHEIWLLPQQTGINGRRLQACACRWAPDQYDSAVLRIRARDAAGSSDASESI